jgi:hypothetical protein
VVSAGFILLYCGPNLPRALSCLSHTPLVLATDPDSPRPIDPDGWRTPSGFEIGDRVRRVAAERAGPAARAWSLDFWNDPDAYGPVLIRNTPSDRDDALRRLLRRDGSPGAADLAIVTDGLEPGDGQARALAVLYRQWLLAFVRRDDRRKTLRDLRGGRVRVYFGPATASRAVATRLLEQFGVEHEEVCAGWEPARVAAAMAAGHTADLAFVLDRPEAECVRAFVVVGALDLLSLDGVGDALLDDTRYRPGATVRPCRLTAGALSDGGGCPSREVLTLEAQAILAGTARLSDLDAYRIARALTEHHAELGLGPVPPDAAGGHDPAAVFGYTPHEGAARYYRDGRRPDRFPYPVLVVAVGASIALVNYWASVRRSWNDDRQVARVDALIASEREDAEALAELAGHLLAETVTLYKQGAISKDGVDRVREYLTLLKAADPGPSATRRPRTPRPGRASA